MADEVSQLAAHPLPPISETLARQTAERALAAAEVSTNPKIKANAQLAGALSTLLLGPNDPNL